MATDGGRAGGVAEDYPQIAAPPVATALFDGDLNGWMAVADEGPARWRVESGGVVVTPGSGNLRTRETFTDFQLHIEFNVPPTTHADPQARGNSGIYLQGRYEVQILDSWQALPAEDGCGAIYGCRAPLWNACRPAGCWQALDIVFRAPLHDTNGLIADAARVTVLHNGVMIHDNVALRAPTPGALDLHQARSGPIVLQDHGSAVRFRNAWVVAAPAC
jgi:hypothetical protein